MPPDSFYLAITTYTEDGKFLAVNADAIEEGRGVVLNKSEASERGSLRTTSSRAPTIDIPTRVVLRKLPRTGRAYSFGRSSDSDLVLPCSSVSRKHFLITLNDRLDCWFLHAHSRTIIDGHELPTEGRTVTALKFDVATKIVVPGFTLYVEPQWIAEVHLDCRNLSGFADLRIESDNGTQTITQTWDAVDSSEEPNGKAKYHMLQRVAWRNARYVQDMSSGQLLVAESVSCEKTAKEALSWRRDIYDKHCPRAVDVYTDDGSTFLIVEAPKPLWQLEDLAEVFSVQPLRHRPAFALLLDLLRTIEYLYMHQICHGAIRAENIMVAWLSPDDSRFILANLSDASRAARNLKKRHQADVANVLQTVSNACPDLFLGDPVAHSIFNGLQTRITSTFISAEEVRHAFDAFTLRGIPEFPFTTATFCRSFRLRKLKRGCFHKSELAAFARAHLTKDIFEAWRMHERVMHIKAVKNIPKPFGDCVEWEAAEVVLGCLDISSDWSDLSALWVKDVVLRFDIVRHKDLDLWNISQLLVARQPQDILDVKPLEAIPIFGEKAVTGLYVDSQTFANACNGMKGLRQVYPERLPFKIAQTLGRIPNDRIGPPEQFCFDGLWNWMAEQDVSPPTRGKGILAVAGEAISSSAAIDLTTPMQLPDTYQSLLEQGNAILLADRRLVNGIAAFDLASRTMKYTSETFSESRTFHLCEKYSLDALKFGIEQSQNPHIDAILNGEFVIDFYASEHESTTASYRSSFQRFDLEKRHNFDSENIGTGHCSSRIEQSNRTERWVAEQKGRKRKRYLCRADIVPTRWVGQESVDYSIQNKDNTESTLDQALSLSKTSQANHRTPTEVDTKDSLSASGKSQASTI